MSVDVSKDKTSPNIEGSIRQNPGGQNNISGQLMTQLGPSGSNAQASLTQLQKMGRVRRSYSMVSSLEKLTHKLKSVEQEKGQFKQHVVGMEEEKQSPNVARIRKDTDLRTSSPRPIM